MSLRLLLGWGLLISLLGGCALPSPRVASPVPLAGPVELERFMGDWYVIGVIPTFIEHGAHNAVESYALNPDGRIATTFRRRDGGFDGPVKIARPIATVVPGTGNALWGMQFVWPFQGEFRIAHLEPDYSVTIIARSQLDYVWLMSRRPEMDEARFQRYRELIASWGYEVSRFMRVPQRWPEMAP